MGEQRPTLLFTDPPYNVNYYGGDRPKADARPNLGKKWSRIYSDNMSQPEYEEWLAAVLGNAVPRLVNGSPMYVWNGHKQFASMHRILEDLGCHVACVITWAKQNFAISYGDYNQQTEFCLYGWKEGGAHRWYGPTNESTLWEVRRDATKTYVHPTQKPIALAQRAIRNSSLRDDLVLDLFLGSGSTLIAAETMGRRCFGMELDPRYCDAIVRRYCVCAGKSAVSADLAARYALEAAV